MMSFIIFLLLHFKLEFGFVQKVSANFFLVFLTVNNQFVFNNI